MGIFTTDTPSLLEAAFATVEEAGLMWHGLYQPGTGESHHKITGWSPDTYGSAPWNVRLMYPGTQIYGYGGGETLSAAIYRAIDYAQHHKYLVDNPPPRTVVKTYENANINLEDLGL